MVPRGSREWPVAVGRGATSINRYICEPTLNYQNWKVSLA